jgi:bifunctional oligoribonuclease and PAP phosphatase NrnA
MNLTDQRPFDLQTLREARLIIQEANNIVILSHIRPDGDAIGSVLGLGLALKNSGKKVQMVLLDGLPSIFRFLPGASEIRTSISTPYDLAVIVDCSDLDRIGEALQPGTKPDINIDHHATNLHFARLNLVDETAVSTTSMLADILPKLGLTINQEVASALLTGLLTDSLGFRTPNMSPTVLRTAANLMEFGASLPELYYMALTRRTFEAARLWGIGLSNLRRNNGLVWTSISMDERQSVGYQGRDDADLVNILTTIQDANIALIFLEQPDGRVKISWRSKQGYDISDLAFQFGGGGHRNAAGASVEGTLNSVQDQVLYATRALLNTHISEAQSAM